MVEKQLKWTQQPVGEVPTPWGALLLMRGGCMGPSYPFPSQGERKQETVPQLWGCDKLIFSSSKPTAMKKQGPKAAPRRGGAVRIGMPRKPGAEEALELQGKGLKTGVGAGGRQRREGGGTAEMEGCKGRSWRWRASRPKPFQNVSSCQYLLSSRDSWSNF